MYASIFKIPFPSQFKNNWRKMLCSSSVNDFSHFGAASVENNVEFLFEQSLSLAWAAIYDGKSILDIP